MKMVLGYVRVGININLLIGANPKATLSLTLSQASVQLTHARYYGYPARALLTSVKQTRGVPSIP